MIRVTTAITETVSTYTYASITTDHPGGISASVIVYDNSTAEDFEIWAEFDDCDGLTYEERTDLLGRYNDGYTSIAEAVEDMAYIFLRTLEQLGYCD